MSESLSACVEKINRLVQSLVALVTQCDPLQLLDSVYWHMNVRIVSPDPVPNLQKEDVEWIWTLSYVQNVIASISPTSKDSMLDADDGALKARRLVGDLMQLVSTEYLFESAHQKVLRGESSQIESVVELLARHDWLHIRRSRFPRHDSTFLRKVLSRHDDALGRNFRVNTEMLAEALSRQVNYHRFAVSLAMARRLGIEVPGDDFLSLSPQLQNLIAYAFLNRRDDPELPRELRRAAGERYCDFGEISKLPASLLDELSWEPGGEKKFLAPGDLCGWPLRITPIHQRPLVKINNRYFCFVSDVLSTMLYRCMYWALRDRDPSYMQLWEKRQKEACEEFAAEWFERALPGAQIIPNYYVDNPESPKADKIEHDLLVRFDDVLLLIECKGGNFTLLPPETRFTAFQKSIKTLVLKPFTQSMQPRFMLQQGDLIVHKRLEDGTYQEITRFNKHDFRVIVCCGVMLESFPGPAAREASFQVLMHTDKDLPFWSVAIEDLLACEDLFHSPTMFLHFLQWRTRPGRTMALASEELDYVISYFREREGHENPPASKQEHIPWYMGGTEAIARMYWTEDSERQRQSASQGEFADPRSEPEVPETSELTNLRGQTMRTRDAGSLYLEMHRFLDTTNRPGRARVAATLYGLCGPARERLIKGLDHASAVANYDLGTILGSGVASLLIIATPERRPLLDIEVRTRGLRFLKVLGNPETTAIVLTLRTNGRLGNMSWQFLKAGELI